MNVTNSPTEDGMTEEDFCEMTRQVEAENDMNELNQMIDNYLQNAPKRSGERGDPKPPYIQKEFSKSYHDILNLKKTLINYIIH